MIDKILNFIIVFGLITLPVFSDDIKERSGNGNKPSVEDLKIIAVMEYLELMDLVEDLELIKDLDYVIGENQNEKNK